MKAKQSITTQKKICRCTYYGFYAEIVCVRSCVIEIGLVWLGSVMTDVVRNASIVMQCALWRTIKCSKLCCNPCIGSLCEHRTICSVPFAMHCQYYLHRNMTVRCAIATAAPNGICLQWKFVSFHSRRMATHFQFGWEYATDIHCHAHSAWLSLSFARMLQVLLSIEVLLRS